MATKRKAKKKSNPRRRRMGSVSRVTIMDAVKLVGGMAIGGIAATAADNALKGINPKLASAGKIIGGLMLSKSKSDLMRGAGYGIAVSGAMQLSYNLGIMDKVRGYISGISSDLDDPYFMNGISNDGLVSGVSNEDMVSSGSAEWQRQFAFNDPYNPGTLGGMRRGKVGALGGD